jgi:hypothetical protein
MPQHPNMTMLSWLAEQLRNKHGQNVSKQAMLNAAKTSTVLNEFKIEE